MTHAHKNYSLRRRLLLWLLIPTSVIGLFALYDADRSARQTANGIFDRILSGSALAIAERIFVNHHGDLDVDIPYVALDMLTSSAQDRVFYRIDGPPEVFITGYKNLTIPTKLEFSNAGFAFVDGVFRHNAVRIAIYRNAASTGQKSISYHIAVAETTNARAALSKDILLRSASRLALLILAAAVIVWIAVTRALFPLQRLEAAIDRRGSDELRPILHHVPQELGGVVKTINEFMGRLETALSALKNFTSNAGHQIRTPLAIMRTQLTLAKRAGNREQLLTALADCDEAAIDADRILAQLMLMARIDETASKDIRSQTANLTEIAKNTAESYVIDAAREGYDMDFESDPDVFCKCDPTLLRELIGNLIDNAIKHARPGNKIVVAVQKEKDRAAFKISDNGMGIPEDQYEDMLKRFETGDVATRQGSGLGLPIVREIARLFDGNLILDQGLDGKGLSVEINFPYSAAFSDQLDSCPRIAKELLQ